MGQNSIKKILYIHHSGNFGGAPLSLSYLLESIDRSKYQPILINISEGPANEIFKNLNIEPQILHGTGPFHGSTVSNMNWKVVLKNLFYFFPTVFKGYKKIKSLDPDLIHLNSTCLFPFAIASKIFKNNFPIVCHVREPIRNDISGWPLRYFTKKYVDGLIAISEFDLKSLQLEPNSSVKSKIIYNFVDHNFIETKTEETDVRSNFGIKKNDIVFLYLARFTESNGWKELINYAEELIKRRSNCHFILAGADSTIDKSKYEIPNVHILNFQRDIKLFLKDADIYVCPFTQPHFARGIIEASAWSLPILANDIGGVNELVVHNKTGYLYHDMDSFIKYSMKLVDDLDLRTEFGRAGLRLVKNKFSYEKNTRETFEFYHEII